jgi:ankyrin repeat protein
MDAELWDMIWKLQTIDMGGYDERTVLIHACITNHFALAKRLVEFGADVNKKDYFQKTALHCAVIVGNIDIVSLLLSHHANVNMQARQGFTALDFAAFNAAKLSQDELDKMVRLLISYGAKTKKELLNA